MGTCKESVTLRIRYRIGRTGAGSSDMPTM